MIRKNIGFILFQLFLALGFACVYFALIRNDNTVCIKMYMDVLQMECPAKYEIDWFKTNDGWFDECWAAKIKVPGDFAQALAKRFQECKSKEDPKNRVRASTSLKDSLFNGMTECLMYEGVYFPDEGSCLVLGVVKDVLGGEQNETA